MKNVITYVICVVLVEASGFAVGMMTRNGMQIYADIINKPPLSPPGIIFPIAWTVLYALMAIGFARVLLSDGGSYRVFCKLYFASSFWKKLQRKNGQSCMRLCLCTQC